MLAINVFKETQQKNRKNNSRTFAFNLSTNVEIFNQHVDTIQHVCWRYISVFISVGKNDIPNLMVFK